MQSTFTIYALYYSSDDLSSQFIQIVPATSSAEAQRLGMAALENQPGGLSAAMRIMHSATFNLNHECPSLPEARGETKTWVLESPKVDNKMQAIHLLQYIRDKFLQHEDHPPVDILIEKLENYEEPELPQV